MKKVLVLISVVFLITLFGGVCYAEDSVTGISKEMTVQGDIQATLVSFTVPTETGFIIDPNQSIYWYEDELIDEQFNAPGFVIVNQSSAPLVVELNSFAGDPSAEHNFTDVLPSAHVDWTALRKADSMRDLALGIKLYSADWATLDVVAPVYAVQVTSPVRLGVLNPYAAAKVDFVASHGSAFNTRIQTKYKMVFVFSLE